jgi:prephenate dehydratase
MKVGYLGPEGTFSEEAGKVYRRKLEGKVLMVPYTTIHDLLFAADQGSIDEALVPIENSIDGTIGTVTDMLVKDVDLKIRQEIILPVFHYLLAQKGFHIKEITDIRPNGIMATFEQKEGIPDDYNYSTEVENKKIIEAEYIRRKILEEEATKEQIRKDLGL